MCKKSLAHAKRRGQISESASHIIGKLLNVKKRKNDGDK